MVTKNEFEVIIIGGSYAGLSAAMSLGRALRRVLIIDSGKPCNRQTPHSHNFITQDGNTPSQIAEAAKAQVLKYNTVQFQEALAVNGSKTNSGFKIEAQDGAIFTAKKLIFATGLTDVFPEINGFAECWGISVLHCPYCHGYEYSNQKTGILTNGDVAFELSKLIKNWTKDLTIFTNGPSALTPEQVNLIKKNGIEIEQKEIEQFVHNRGQIERIVFKDQSEISVNALYARPNLVQHCSIPAALGCELTEQGLLKTDMMQKTTVPGVIACGDNATFGRAVSVAVAAGTMAGASANKELIEEEFSSVS
ncbi:NAD(P)/FAD-dependent oxidoreductase [Adhaeribacter rhizoryzae]|uniref:NAD(P)/FAD-dependent oxidoreductase n=1 Tax=Adhaeribacter rhizoryzae TaxID=2607907 RepID=A0A5M6DFJ7_9BACT|nr:NAD(P)/FAD-dependent oxidoreductase [Adhaeribacter rhizoryzae]KAA5545052.1 NAD(P)/FAD-dependent oxidoreductase [Adhaeribacter rhizoryzae]